MACNTVYETLTEEKAASEVFDNYDNIDRGKFNEQLKRWSEFKVTDCPDGIYTEIRNVALEAFQKSLRDNNCEINYTLDLNVGIALYEFLNPDGNNFDIITACDDDFWRNISLHVIPDLTCLRYPNSSDDIEVFRESLPELTYSFKGELKPESYSGRLRNRRFYLGHSSKRIWAKTLWWYIYLGWQGDKETTFNVLKDNGSNTISQLIERTGTGYRVDLYRAIMRAYSSSPVRSDKIFRAAMKLNLAKCATVEPGLMASDSSVEESVEESYARRLFDEVKNI